MGTNAGKLLGVSLIIAYTSSVLAATISAAAGYALVPQLGITSADAVERAVPGAVFQLNIPQVMPIMTVLILSIVVGIAAYGLMQKQLKIYLLNLAEIHIFKIM